MPQQQRVIPLEFVDGTKSAASATGNNAAWLCRCSRVTPLIGRSGLSSGPTPGLTVECPDCATRYFVKPDGGSYKAAHTVTQLEN